MNNPSRLECRVSHVLGLGQAVAEPATPSADGGKVSGGTLRPLTTSIGFMSFLTPRVASAA
jgi:hypothetical protein